MVKGDKVRLNHELLLFAGFTFSNGVWSYPDGETVDDGVPFFPDDLNAIFKRLMPELDGFQWSEVIKVWAIKLIFNKEADPALALCLAVKELINAKE